MLTPPSGNPELNITDLSRFTALQMCLSRHNFSSGCQLSDLLRRNAIQIAFFSANSRGAPVKYIKNQQRSLLMQEIWSEYNKDVLPAKQSIPVPKVIECCE